MKINKQSPPESVKNRLVETLKNEKNEDYAQNILSGRGEYKRVVLKGVASAAAVFAVAVVVAVFALIGREIWHSDKITPASAPDYPNYIFIEGKLAGMAQDGEFSELLISRAFTFNEILANDCLYDENGNEIKEIYINVSELKQLNRDETVTIAERLKKYASGEFRNYYKFTLPVTMDDEISINSGNIDYAFSEDEIVNGALDNEHGYVSAYRLNIKPLKSFESKLTEKEMVALADLTEQAVNASTPVYSADIDGDGKKEKVANIFEPATASGRIGYYVAVVDGDTEWIVCYDYEAMKSEAVDKYQLLDVIDFDLDGKYEIVVSESRRIEVYSANEGGATKVFSVYLAQEQTGLTIREFAARVANMALGTPYDPDYPSDESCEWYMRAYQTENMNLDTVMNYNQIYYGVEMFANMYHFNLKGWDKETIWEPIAELYDPTVTATRERAEELLAKAKTAFENSTVSFDFSNDNITKMAINGKEFSVDNSIEISLIESNLKKLSSLKITDVEYIGGVTGVAKTMSLYTADGYEVFSCSYDDGHIYTNECVYTIEGDELKYIIFGYVVN